MSGDLSLYFHIPFCSKKCPYCHFYVVKDNTLLKKKFLESLKKEWEQKLPLIKGKKIVSIYFGGGTPSLLTTEEFAYIFSFFDFPLADIEITLEANPENINDLKDLKDLGFNRLSIGVQSFDDRLLKKLGRIHNAQKAIDSIYEAQLAGFENISIDLMYDLPDQTIATFEETLKTTLTLPITHVSLYNLTIEPYTSFYKQKETLKKTIPKDEESLDMLNLALFHLEKKFKRYEISAFANEGCHSRHNTGYWTGRPFLGYGPSAFSYYEKSRFSNVSSIVDYERKMLNGFDPADFKETLSNQEHFQELLAVRLRYFTPFSLCDLDEEIPSHITPLLQNFQKEGYLEEKNGKISLTKSGTFFYDSIAEAII